MIVDAGLAQRYRRKTVVAQQQPIFVELGGIGGGNQQRFHRVDGRASATVFQLFNPRNMASADRL